MYDTAEYANSRLAETIVRIGDVPIYVVCVRAGMVVEYTILDSDDDSVHTCKLEELNLEPVPLGYFNTHKSAYYASRQPRRDDWRQGLRQQLIS